MQIAPDRLISSGFAAVEVHDARIGRKIADPADGYAMRDMWEKSVTDSDHVRPPDRSAAGLSSTFDGAFDGAFDGERRRTR
ncbi:hypothetical protein [Pseudonocardia sp. D17]|uniref:hypothetical protein n=1 Tax=Pseudonocardia sp. D17 TaxID=882661 RepID=UPI002B37F601|nr:hypothetical protein PSD17_10580 [Pseudonocardia sp. D17]